MNPSTFGRAFILLEVDYFGSQQFHFLPSSLSLRREYFFDFFVLFFLVILMIKFVAFEVLFIKFFKIF